MRAPVRFSTEPKYQIARLSSFSNSLPYPPIPHFFTILSTVFSTLPRGRSRRQGQSKVGQQPSHTEGRSSWISLWHFLGTNGTTLGCGNSQTELVLTWCADLYLAETISGKVDLSPSTSSPKSPPGLETRHAWGSLYHRPGRPCQGSGVALLALSPLLLMCCSLIE